LEREQERTGEIEEQMRARNTDLKVEQYRGAKVAIAMASGLA